MAMKRTKNPASVALTEEQEQSDNENENRKKNICSVLCRRRCHRLVVALHAYSHFRALSSSLKCAWHILELYGCKQCRMPLVAGKCY